MRRARVEPQRAVNQIFERFIGWDAPRGRGGMPLERLARSKTAGDLRLALFVDAHDRVGRRKVGLRLLDGFGGIALDRLVERLDFDLGIGDAVCVLAIFHAGRRRTTRAEGPSWRRGTRRRAPPRASTAPNP